MTIVTVKHMVPYIQKCGVVRSCTKVGRNRIYSPISVMTIFNITVQHIVNVIKYPITLSNTTCTISINSVVFPYICANISSNAIKNVIR